jgi:putative transposase
VPLLESVWLKGLLQEGRSWQAASMSYPSDLSDGQWQRVEKVFERPDPRGAREKHPKRRVLEAIFSTACKEGCRWRALPHDFAPWSTVASHFRLWRRRGLWQEALAVLGTRWREVSLGRARRAPRHAILDSQSVKTAAEGEQRGFHGGKKVKGR